MLRHNSNSQRNRLLGAASREDFARLSAHLQPVAMELRERLEEHNRPIKHIYFMEEGVASVVAVAGDGMEIEVGLIGREGMSGSFVVMGSHQSPHSTFVQVRGRAQRIGTEELRAAMASRPLRELLLRYVQTFTVQTAQTAIANARASVEERLARWLLMLHDRTESDELPLTHEFVSLMLGVRRAGVTVAVHALESRGLIQSGRGHVMVLDRKGLEQTAGRYYGVPEAEYRRLMA